MITQARTANPKIQETQRAGAFGRLSLSIFNQGPLMLPLTAWLLTDTLTLPFTQKNPVERRLRKESKAPGFAPRAPLTDLGEAVFANVEPTMTGI
jgi:hypothetical protein